MSDVSLRVRDAMVERLKATTALAKLNIRARPKKVDLKTFSALAQTGAALIQNIGSQYEPRAIALGSVVQEREIFFDIVLIYRNAAERASSDGGADDEVYEYAFEIIKALQGWRPPDCYEAMRVLGDDFIDEYDGIWQYGIRFAVKTLTVQEVSDLQEPRLSEALFNENLL
jgi:hypothetical protein